MATTEQPITRSVLREEMALFREEMHRTLDHYATKADLYKAIVQLGIAMTGVVGLAVAFLKLTEDYGPI